jgi:hypothetical protein
MMLESFLVACASHEATCDFAASLLPQPLLTTFALSHLYVATDRLFHQPTVTTNEKAKRLPLVQDAHGICCTCASVQDHVTCLAVAFSLLTFVIQATSHPQSRCLEHCITRVIPDLMLAQLRVHNGCHNTELRRSSCKGS